MTDRLMFAPTLRGEASFEQEGFCLVFTGQDDQMTAVVLHLHPVSGN